MKRTILDYIIIIFTYTLNNGKLWQTLFVQVSAQKAVFEVQLRLCIIDYYTL